VSAGSAPGIDRPLTLLIAALGGEGGGLLADWVVEAASREGVLVQSTSIPGVAQRTGATTYYVEMMKPRPGEAREPVFGLYPAPGDVDIMASSELIEAGRAMENGFVTPDRTTLIASTHRVFAMAEKMAPGSGAFDSDRVIEAAQQLAARALLGDFDAVARRDGLALNALLLGLIAGSGLCPVSAEAFRDAIRTRGVAVDNNLAGFEAGLGLAADQGPPGRETSAIGRPATTGPNDLPAEVAPIAAEGVRRLADYQDHAYGRLYLDRVKRILELEQAHGGTTFAATRATARYLALWMAYEDVIRVADLKSRATRYRRVREETRAKGDEPVRVTEFLKPGLDELATILPAGIGRRLTAWAERRGLDDRLHVALKVRSDTISGYLRLRLVASLRVLRRRGLRYQQEQAMIERWLDSVARAVRIGGDFGAEVAEAGRVIKGYSDTRRRAFAKMVTLLDEVVEPALAGAVTPDDAAARLRAANRAALADEDGKALRELLSVARSGGPTCGAGTTADRQVAAAE
jgi:indolepyruvate ferredoxin oxidoreductase beta subunit